MPSKCVCIQIPFNATIDTSDRSRSACISVRTRFVARVEAGALPNKTADNVKRWFWENIVCRYGTPPRNCDRQQWRIQRGIRSAAATLRRHPPPYVTTPSTSHWARGKNEPNSYSLAREVNSARKNWDEKIPLALLGTRASRQATTKLAPAEVLLGHKSGCQWLGSTGAGRNLGRQCHARSMCHPTGGADGKTAAHGRD